MRPCDPIHRQGRLRPGSPTLSEQGLSWALQGPKPMASSLHHLPSPVCPLRGCSGSRPGSHSLSSRKATAFRLVIQASSPPPGLQRGSPRPRAGQGDGRPCLCSKPRVLISVPDHQPRVSQRAFSQLGPSVPLLLLSPHASQAIWQNPSVRLFSPGGWGHTFARVASLAVSLSRHLQSFMLAQFPSLRRLRDQNLRLQEVTEPSQTPGGLIALIFCPPQTGREGAGSWKRRSLPRRTAHLFETQKARQDRRPPRNSASGEAEFHHVGFPGPPGPQLQTASPASLPSVQPPGHTIRSVS